VHRFIPALSFPHAGLGQRLRQAGFSLHELLVTSVIAGAVGTGAVGFVGLMQDTRMTTAVNGMMGDLALARSEAIKRSSATTLCASTTMTECQESREWRDGWIMFWDPNGNGKLEPGETLLRVQEATAIKSLNFGAWGPGTGRWLTYEADGTTKQNGTFTFCDSRGASKAKAVIMLGTGRPRVSAKTSEGKPLRCS
jgi:type IV fimbrial biogenesis protein FimT